MSRTSPHLVAGTATLGLGDAEVASRLAVVIRNIRLDCDCKRRLNEALSRFVAHERRRVIRRTLLEARARRDEIEAFLVFLKELDDLPLSEPDESVHKEMAILFEDIAKAARQGAELMLQLPPFPSA
jgi:hypothetical protein